MCIFYVIVLFLYFENIFWLNILPKNNNLATGIWCPQWLIECCNQLA